jgi:hypothetical protein
LGALSSFLGRFHPDLLSPNFLLLFRYAVAFGLLKFICRRPIAMSQANTWEEFPDPAQVHVTLGNIETTCEVPRVPWQYKFACFLFSSKFHLCHWLQRDLSYADNFSWS